MATKKNPSVKNMMYEQQVSHLPRGTTTDNLYDIVNDKLNPSRFAVVVHDKDISDDGSPAEPHVHVMMCYKNARSIANVAKILGDKPQYIEKWDKRADLGFSYLCHRNEGAKGKYQYDITTDVKANFDFPALMTKLEANARKTKKAIRVNELLDGLKSGTVTMAEVEHQLSGSLYGKYAPQISRINTLRLKREAEEWRRKAKAEGRIVRVIWIYGVSGTGKSSLAKKYAKQRNEPFFISGSSRDIFQSYSGQHTIILDELRPNMITYSDLLRLTNPYSIDEGTMAPSRYSDKAIAADLYIVTSPFAPIMFYKMCDLNEYDSFAQLERRIVTTICMTEDEIIRMSWDDENKGYFPVDDSAVPNPYSSKNYPSTESDAADTYAAIISMKGGKDDE